MASSRAGTRADTLGFLSMLFVILAAPVMSRTTHDGSADDSDAVRLIQLAPEQPRVVVMAKDADYPTSGSRAAAHDDKDNVEWQQTGSAFTGSDDVDKRAGSILASRTSHSGIGTRAGRMTSSQRFDLGKRSADAAGSDYFRSIARTANDDEDAVGGGADQPETEAETDAAWKRGGRYGFRGDLGKRGPMKFRGDLGRKRRGKSAFRGDLGKRADTSLMTSHLMAQLYGVVPDDDVDADGWKSVDEFDASRERRAGGRSGFRGDLGKRRSSFRGDLGKRSNDLEPETSGYDVRPWYDGLLAADGDADDAVDKRRSSFRGDLGRKRRATEVGGTEPAHDVSGVVVRRRKSAADDDASDRH